MEGGNNLEQATALVAAANKVVQDPNSVGSALRTISLRLRGTSVEILEEMGEETDGVVESTSKLQEKLKALTGVDILTDAGDYKDTYTILKEIGHEWENISDIDKAATLELMAGKNRANTLSAILSNMEDLEGAYESALGAEGSALKENEAFLDSIQGRINTFNNAVQTMWMNLLDSDVIKFIVDIGTGIVNLITQFGELESIIAAVFTWFSVFSKSKIDLASIFGIHDIEKGFTFGKEGLSGKIAELFKEIPDIVSKQLNNIKIKKDSKNDLVGSIIGDVDDAKVTAQDLAGAIGDSISNFASIDTTKIDTEIEDVTNKLMLARKELDSAKNADWDYYKSLGSKTPAKDRDARVSATTQKIDALEAKLMNLQETRASLISDTVTAVSESLVTQVSAEATEYQSMFSVLSEIKNIKLSMGSEQDAAAKIDAISAAAKKGQAELANYITTLGDGDTALKAYIASVNDGSYSLAGYQQFIQAHNAGIEASGTKAKAAAAAHGAFNAVLSMGIGLIAGWAINKIIEGLDNFINSSKKAKQEAESALSSYEKTQKNLRNQKSTVDELSAAYKRLSKGVNTNNNTNIDLSTSSYQEYLDVCNSIADIYPELVTGFDAQGNAILSLKGNVDGLTQSYKDAEQASRAALISESNNIFGTFKDSYDHSAGVFDQKNTGLKQQLDLAKEFQAAVQSGSINKMQGFYDKYVMGELAADYNVENMLKAAGIASGDLADFEWFKGNVVNQEQWEAVLGQITSFIKATEIEIAQSTSGIKTLMGAYVEELYVDDKYASLSDNAKTNISQIISSFNAEFIQGFSSIYDLYAWFETNIVDLFANGETNDVLSDAFDLQEQFKSNEIYLKDYQKGMLEFVNSVKKLEIDDDAKNQILQLFDINLDDSNSVGKNIDQMITYAQSIVDDAAKDKVLHLTYSDLQVINSSAFKVPEGTLLTWDELNKKIQETKVAITKDFTIDNFSEYADSISSIQSGISAYKEALEGLESGTFTLSDFIELIEQFPELADGVDTSSKSFKGLAKNLKQAIRNSPDKLIDDLEDLRDRLKEADKETDVIDDLINSLKNIPYDIFDNLSDNFTLDEQFTAAKQALNELQKAMQENPNEGFETRGEAIDQMKTLMEQGAIGSESELWSIAEAFGFTYNSAKSINENADALYNFITAREKWYATDEDGNYVFDGTKNFLDTVTKATNSDKWKEVLAKHNLTPDDFKWSFDGTSLDFDFDNADWDKIVVALSEMPGLIGLTSEEWADLMVQVGQFYDINWQDADDVSDYIDSIANSSETAQNKLESITKTAERYAEKVLGQDLDFDNLDLSKITKPTEVDNDEFEELISFLNHYIDLRDKITKQDTLGIEGKLDQKGLEGLYEITEIQSAIKKNSDGVIVVDEDALRSSLKSVGYMDEAIDDIVEKIQQYQILAERTSDDPLGIKGAHASITTVSSALDELGINYFRVREEVGGEPIGLKINVDNLVATLAEKGWTSDQIQSYMNTLTSDENGVKVEFDAEVSKEDIDAAVKKANEEAETLSVDISGTAQPAITSMRSDLDEMTAHPYNVVVNTVTNGEEQGETFGPTLPRIKLVPSNIATSFSDDFIISGGTIIYNKAEIAEDLQYPVIPTQNGDIEYNNGLVDPNLTVLVPSQEGTVYYFANDTLDDGEKQGAGNYDPENKTAYVNLFVEENAQSEDGKTPIGSYVPDTFDTLLTVTTEEGYIDTMTGAQAAVMAIPGTVTTDVGVTIPEDYATKLAAAQAAVMAIPGTVTTDVGVVIKNMVDELVAAGYGPEQLRQYFAKFKGYLGEDALININVAEMTKTLVDNNWTSEQVSAFFSGLSSELGVQTAFNLDLPELYSYLASKNWTYAEILNFISQINENLARNGIALDLDTSSFETLSMNLEITGQKEASDALQQWINEQSKTLSITPEITPPSGENGNNDLEVGKITNNAGSDYPYYYSNNDPEDDPDVQWPTHQELLEMYFNGNQDSISSYNQKIEKSILDGTYPPPDLLDVRTLANAYGMTQDQIDEYIEWLNQEAKRILKENSGATTGVDVLLGDNKGDNQGEYNLTPADMVDAQEAIPLEADQVVVNTKGQSIETQEGDSLPLEDIALKDAFENSIIGIHDQIEKLDQHSEDAYILTPEDMANAKDANMIPSQEDLMPIQMVHYVRPEDMSDQIETLKKEINVAIESEDPFINLQQIEGIESAFKMHETLWGEEFEVLDTTILNQLLTDANLSKEEIIDLVAKIQECQDVLTIESNPDPLGLSNVDLDLQNLELGLRNLGVEYNKVSDFIAGEEVLQLNVVDLVTTLKNNNWTDAAIAAYCQQLSDTIAENGLDIELNGVETVDEELKVIGDNKIEDKEFEVGIADTSTVLAQLDAINNYVIADKSYTTTNKIITTNGTKTVHTSGGGRYTVAADGTAHVYGTAYKGGSWGASNTETALVGELGPEMIVRNGRWTTVGDNGAEFTQIKKGDIIFNHKQTEDLLSKGYVTGRGKAYAQGTAFASGNGTHTKYTFSDTTGSEIGDAASKLSQAAEDTSDAADEFSEVFDWIEVRLEEINEDIDLKSAKLENAIGSSKQNTIINDIIKLNQKLYDNLVAGANKYYQYAAKLLEKVPAEYRKAAQDGSIAIESFVGEVDEKTLEAIENYREWVQKGADLTQQAEETLTEISSLAKQAIDNIAQDYENKISIPTIKIDQLEAYNELAETTLGAESEKIYQAMIKANDNNIALLKDQRDAMQTELNKRVTSGEIKKYSQDWYDAVNEIAEVDTEILNLTSDIESYQDAINELHWDHFDNILGKLEAISDEADSLIDILGSDDLVDKDTAEWTDEGITTLGLYAQQLENAEMQAAKYSEEIKYLNKNWQKLGYTEQEYVEKLEELKNGQYDAIKAYNDTKDAIVDLNKERVDAIKTIIEDEIEAYEKLIDTKKKELDQEKD